MPSALELACFLTFIKALSFAPRMQCISRYGFQVLEINIAILSSRNHLILSGAVIVDAEVNL